MMIEFMHEDLPRPVELPRLSGCAASRPGSPRLARPAMSRCHGDLERSAWLLPLLGSRGCRRPAHQLAPVRFGTSTPMAPTCRGSGRGCARPATPWRRRCPWNRVVTPRHLHARSQLELVANAVGPAALPPTRRVSTPCAASARTTSALPRRRPVAGRAQLLRRREHGERGQDPFARKRAAARPAAALRRPAPTRARGRAGCRCPSRPARRRRGVVDVLRRGPVEERRGGLPSVRGPPSSGSTTSGLPPPERRRGRRRRAGAQRARRMPRRRRWR